MEAAAKDTQLPADKCPPAVRLLRLIADCQPPTTRSRQMLFAHFDRTATAVTPATLLPHVVHCSTRVGDYLTPVARQSAATTTPAPQPAVRVYETPPSRPAATPDHSANKGQERLS